jgi:hypothetical protein
VLDELPDDDPAEVLVAVVVDAVLVALLAELPVDAAPLVVSFDVESTADCLEAVEAVDTELCPENAAAAIAENAAVNAAAAPMANFVSLDTFLKPASLAATGSLVIARLPSCVDRAQCGRCRLGSPETWLGVCCECFKIRARPTENRTVRDFRPYSRPTGRTDTSRGGAHVGRRQEREIKDTAQRLTAEAEAMLAGELGDWATSADSSVGWVPLNTVAHADWSKLSDISRGIGLVLDSAWSGALVFVAREVLAVAGDSKGLTELQRQDLIPTELEMLANADAVPSSPKELVSFIQTVLARARSRRSHPSFGPNGIRAPRPDESRR